LSVSFGNIGQLSPKEGVALTLWYSLWIFLWLLCGKENPRIILKRKL